MIRTKNQSYVTFFIGTTIFLQQLSSQNFLGFKKFEFNHENTCLVYELHKCSLCLTVRAVF